MSRKSAEDRLAAATSSLRTFSAVGTTRRPGVCPQRLGNTWSSIWIAAGALVTANRALNIEEAAEPGIGVADQGRRGVLADLLDSLHHFGVARQTGIGQAQGGGHAKARHVQRAEA